MQSRSHVKYGGSGASPHVDTPRPGTFAFSPRSRSGSSTVTDGAVDASGRSGTDGAKSWSTVDGSSKSASSACARSRRTAAAAAPPSRASAQILRIVAART